MPPSDPNLDRQLREYLSAVEQDRAEGNTIANLRMELHQFGVELREMRASLSNAHLRLDRHGRDIREIKRRMDFGGDDMDTGQHQIEDLRRALAERERTERDSGIWWKRQRWQWTAAALGAVALIILNTLVTYLMTVKR